MTTYEHSLGGGGKEEGTRHRGTITGIVDSTREALLAKFEEAREQIYVEEDVVDRLYEGYLKIFNANFVFYLAILAVGVIGGKITKERPKFDVLLFMCVLIFALGNGVGIWFVNSRFRKVQWKLDGLKRRKDDLRTRALNFQKELDTNTREMAEKVQEIMDSLKDDVFFKTMHLLNIGTTCVCILVMTLICFYNFTQD